MQHQHIALSEKYIKIVNYKEVFPPHYSSYCDYFTRNAQTRHIPIKLHRSRKQLRFCFAYFLVPLQLICVYTNSSKHLTYFRIVLSASVTHIKHSTQALILTHDSDCGQASLDRNCIYVYTCIYGTLQ